MNQLKQKEKKLGIVKKIYFALSTFITSLMITGTTVFASGFGDSVTVKTDTDLDAAAMMGNVIGLILTVCRYVGIGLLAFGIFEIAQSFNQNQPEAKTKGIMMALGGVLMVVMKSILQAIGIIA